MFALTDFKIESKSAHVLTSTVKNEKPLRTDEVEIVFVRCTYNQHYNISFKPLR